MTSSGSARAAGSVSSSSVLRQSDSKMTTRRRARAGASCSPAALSAVASLVTPWPRSRSSRQIGRHTSELQSHVNLVCRLLLEKKKKKKIIISDKKKKKKKKKKK